MRLLIGIVAAGFLLTACGEGQSPTVETGHGIPHAQTGALPKIAFAGSPVRKSRSYINTHAVEPGEDWYDFGGDRIQLSSGYTLRAFETQRIIPRLHFHYAEGRKPDPDLEAQVRRAFKLWTRYLTGIHGTDARIWHTVVQVGHADACSGRAGVLACVWPVGGSGNPYDVPLMQIPAAQADLVARANSPITLLSTLAHEAGHALEYWTLVGHIDPATGRVDHNHAPRWSGQLMAPASGDSTTIGPQLRDLLGVAHKFSYGPELSADQFGWWIDAPPTSDLRAIGAGVRRHFTMTELAGITGDVAGNSVSVTADVVTSDFLKVYSFVDGTPSAPARQDLGSASWEGVLLAVDTRTFGPVLGLAHLDMDLSALALSAEFDNFVQTTKGVAQPWTGPESLSYTMSQNTDGVWHDPLGRVDARFFAGASQLGRYDPAHTVAGHLDDDEANILGAYGAVRQ